MTRTMLLVVAFMVTISSGAALAQARTPTVGVGAGYFLHHGVSTVGLSFSYPLTKDPSPRFDVDGIILSDSSYGVGISGPVWNALKPIGEALDITYSDEAVAKFKGFSVGLAGLTQNLSAWDLGAYCKYTVPIN